MTRTSLHRHHHHHHLTAPAQAPPTHCLDLSRSLQTRISQCRLPVSAPNRVSSRALVQQRCAPLVQHSSCLRCAEPCYGLPLLPCSQSPFPSLPCLLSIAPSSVPGPGPPASPTPSHLARRHLHRGCMPQGGTVTRSGPLASCLLCMPQRPSGGGAQLQPPPRRKLASRHTQQALSLALYLSRPLLLSLSNFLVSCLSVCLPRARTRRMVHDAVVAIAGLEVSLPVGSLESTVRYSRRHAPTFQSASPVTGKWVGGCTLAQI